MGQDHLYRIVEVSLRRGAERCDVGIMTVRQALELPDVPSLEYTYPELRGRAENAFLSRDQLQAHVCG